MNIATPIPSGTAATHDIAGFVSDMQGGSNGPVPLVSEAQTVRRRSRDFFWYSPILNAQLHGKSADIIACPRDEADVIRIAASCAKRRIPLTVRAGATGNYGQAVPPEGGVLQSAWTVTTGDPPGTWVLKLKVEDQPERVFRLQAR